MEIGRRNFADVFAIITHAMRPWALCQLILGEKGIPQMKDEVGLLSRGEFPLPRRERMKVRVKN